MNDNDHILASNLKYLRRANNLSQTKIANILSIAPGLYQHYEAGRSKPQINLLVAISDLYSVDLRDLVSKDISRSTNGSNKPANQFYTKYCQQPLQVKKAIKLLLGIEE